MGRPCARWTADTERAFVLALAQTGQVTLAAAAIGRHRDSCYKRRASSPGFAADWDRTLSELEAARHAEGLAAAAPAGVTIMPALTRTRTDGWTQQRQRQFLRALADTGRYGEAAARVGLSSEAARAFRARSPAFQAMCDKALAEGGTTIEEAAYVRAVEGWEEPIVHRGQVIGYRRRFSDVLTKTLLQQTTAAPARRGGHVAPRLTDEEVSASLAKKLDALDAIERRKRRAAQLAWAERMEREGKAP